MEKSLEFDSDVMRYGPEEDRWVRFLECSSSLQLIDLSAESVQSASLALEGVDHVHRSDRLALRVLAVRHRITNHVLQEHLQLVEFDGELPFFEPTLSTPRVSS